MNTDEKLFSRFFASFGVLWFELGMKGACVAMLLDKDIKEEDPSKYNLFIIYDGYVEEGGASPIVLSMNHNVEYAWEDSAKKAWETSFASLRAAWLKVLMDFKKWTPESMCCRKAQTAGQRFCPDCGLSTSVSRQQSYPDNLEQRAYHSSELVSELLGATNDSFGYDLVEVAREMGWDIPGRIQPGIATVIHSHGGSMLVNYDELKKDYLFDKKKGFWTQEAVSFYEIT